MMTMTEANTSPSTAESLVQEPIAVQAPNQNDGETGKYILREIVETVALFAVIFTLARMTIGNYSIVGMSMEPNYHEAQRLLVDRVSPRLDWLQRGDIVIVRSPGQENTELIKRLIGRPGDSVELRDNRVFVNGVALNEPYLQSGANSGPKNEHARWDLGPDQYFIMGDNRSYSEDSRRFNAVTGDRIAGRALVVYWPFPDFHLVRHHNYE
jgi:signal peptidase I